MARLRVTVTTLDGQELAMKVVDPEEAGTDADEANLTDAEKAFLLAAPDLCPFDCDSCRA